MKAILNKLYGKPKTALSTKKIELSKIDDVFKKLESGAWDVQMATETFNDGAPKIRESKDIMENQMTDLEDGIEALNDLIEQIDELGIEYPQQVVEMLELVERAKIQFDENIKAFADLGMPINAELRID